MAIVNVNYDCGCGKHMKTVEEAVKHADDACHTINVAGSVRPSEHKARKAAVPTPASTSLRPRAVKPAPVAAPAEVQEEDKIGFSNLRARLQRK